MPRRTTPIIRAARTLRAPCRARRGSPARARLLAILPLLALGALAGCDSIYLEIPRIGSELSEAFGHPPLVHRVEGNALEVIFPEELVQGSDSATRHQLAWRIARETHALVGEPAEIPRLSVIFRERQVRANRNAEPREERYSWPMAAVGAGNAAAVDGPRNTPIGAPEMGSMETNWRPPPDGRGVPRRR